MHADLHAAARSLFELDPGAVRCPYPTFAALRAEGPVTWFDELEAFVVTGYDLCVEVLRQPELFSSRNTTGPKTDRQLKDLLRGLLSEDPEIRSMVERRSKVGTVPVLVRADPPLHTRQRAIVNRAFSPSAVRALEPEIAKLTESLIDAFPAAGPVEAVSALAVPLPMTVIANAMGVELDRMDDFKRWSDGLVGGVGRNDLGPDDLAAIVQSRSALEEYLLGVMEQRDAEPAEDLVSRVVHAEVDGERLSTHEALDMLVQFLLAGNETTAKLITSTLFRLAGDPGLADAVRGDPDQIPSLLEEVLRLEPPSTGLYRIAREDTVVGGVPIPAGAALWIVFAAGNRDGARFEEPNACVLGRSMPSPHLGFGLGAHFCLGAGLARTEGRIAIETVLRRFDRLELAVDPADLEYEPSYMVHGIRALPLTLRRAE